MVAGWEVSLEESMKGCRPQEGKSIAGKELPPVPKGLKHDRDGNPPISIVLMYQYIEPAWSAKETSEALSFVIGLAKKLNITGRGRCAAEGLNCTLTGEAENARKFCQGLRDWKPIFNETDFKFTDGLEWTKRFKSFTLQKKSDLVAYGLPVELAPSLKGNETKHLEAVDYHKMMATKDTVIIDVRNRYETEIGRFCPPPDGAEFIDPKVRNSHEFPKWLNMPETLEKLNGKKVMMYCTGGIRCERFSALLSQIKKNNPDFKTEGEYMVRGGVERYMKTFPEGGYWKGKNFLFDKRQEQVPELKPQEELDMEVECVCCVCSRPYGYYRGSFKCSVKKCQVPVIVCPRCVKADQSTMQCPLCKEGHSLREMEKPMLEKAEKRKANSEIDQKRAAKRAKHEGKDPSRRLFVGNLPLTMCVATLKEALGTGVKLVHWIPDRQTGLWYGSTFVEMSTLGYAKRVVEAAKAEAGLKIGKRRLRVNFAPPNEDEAWPPEDFEQKERPPVPVNPGK
jgi:predicted sulfurtransferase